MTWVNERLNEGKYRKGKGLRESRNSRSLLLIIDRTLMNFESLLDNTIAMKTASNVLAVSFSVIVNYCRLTRSNKVTIRQ